MRQHSNNFSVLHYDQTARNRAIGRCLFFLQSCSTSNYVRSVAMSWFQSDVMERLRKKFYSNYRYELRRAQLNQMNDGGDCELWLSTASTTSATPSPAASPTTEPSFRYITRSTQPCISPGWLVLRRIKLRSRFIFCQKSCWSFCEWWLNGKCLSFRFIKSVRQNEPLCIIH